jgi:hypothetical protein
MNKKNNILRNKMSGKKQKYKKDAPNEISIVWVNVV